jgi:hypothetical protein
VDRHASSFPWQETFELLGALVDELDPALDASGRRFVGRDAETGDELSVELPLLLAPRSPLPRRGRSPGRPPRLSEALAAARDRPGLHALVLARAGAVALGLFDDDELVDHKVFKRYVVRGRGRAQPTHLEAKGKSRYGSRLRLANARALRRDALARMDAWSAEHGLLDGLYYAAPVRLWAELTADADLPLAEGDAAEAVPGEVGQPSFEEMLRVRRRLGRGRIVWARPA